MCSRSLFILVLIRVFPYKAKSYAEWNEANSFPSFFPLLGAPKRQVGRIFSVTLDIHRELTNLRIIDGSLRCYYHLIGPIHPYALGIHGGDINLRPSGGAFQISAKDCSHRVAHENRRYLE